MGNTNLAGTFSLDGSPVIPGGGELPLGASYFYVSSTTGSDGFPGTWDEPFATLDYAIGRCTANKGDTIVIKQGHAETLIAAGGVTADVAGVNIVGLGVGADRPEFTFGTSTGASFLISAANISVSNIVGIAGIDGLTNPFHVQAANCSLDIEWQDGSSTVEAARAVLTTAAADKLAVNLKYIGFPAGNATVNAIRLVGSNDVRINIDAYGVFSTAVVEFLTTACTNVNVQGYMYNSGTTNFSKSVVDTVTGSTWFAAFYDGAAASFASGGSGGAIAADDVAVVAAGVVTIAANQAVPSADSTANTLERDVIGNKTDAAQPVVGATRSLMGALKGLMNSTNRTIVKTDGAVLSGADPLFTITGGPIKIVSIVGRVTTIIGGAANGTLQATTTVPASTTAMSTTVAINDDAAGTVYTFVGPTGVLTPTTAGVVLMDYGSTTLTPTQYIVNPGTIEFLGSAAQSGVIEWTMDYVPMSPSAVVTAAA